MSTLEHQLGRTLREVREQRGWSQEALAALANLDRSYLGEIERGKVSPSLATLNKLAHAIGLPVSELLKLTELSA